MTDTCFSGAALVLLGVIWGVVAGVVTTVFWLFVKSQQDTLRDCRAQRDQSQADRNRAADALDAALRVGEIAIQAPPVRRSR